MRNRRAMAAASVLVAVGIAVMAAGCIPSLHPLYTEKDLVFDPSIVGVWAEKDADASRDSWEFKKAGEKGYELVVKEEGVAAKFDAHLVKLGEYRFLDTYPAEKAGEPEHELYSLHTLPAHLFWKMWMREDVLYLALLDPDWIDKKMEQDKLEVKHEEVEGTPVLTAQRKELQKFILKAVEDPKAFNVDEVEGLYRQKPTAEKEIPKGAVEEKGEGSGAED